MKAYFICLLSFTILPVLQAFFPVTVPRQPVVLWKGETKRQPPGELHPHFFQNSKDLWIYTKQWLPQRANTKGLVFLIHGASEYCERYEHVAQQLVACGFAVFALDHQGHGRSEGERMYVERFTDYVDDFLQFVQRTLDSDKSYRRLPRLMYGHSMGALIAILSSMRSRDEGVEWSGMVLSSAALWPEISPPHERFVLSILSEMVPRWAIPWERGPGIKFRQTHIDSAQTHFCNDPLIYHGGVRVRFAHELLSSAEAATLYASLVSLPYLAVHGAEDQIAPPQGSLRWHDRTSSADKTCRIIPHAFHELHNEQQDIREHVMQTITTWMLHHTS